MKKIYLSLIVFIILISLFGCGENNEVKKTVKAPGTFESYIGKYYDNVYKDFKKAGFKNVSTEKSKDIKGNSEFKEGAIESIVVNGNKKYSTGTKYSDDVKVVIRYHSKAEFTANINIDLKKNLLFSKYDVYFIVDGSTKEIIEHGSDKVYKYELTYGKHILTFASVDDNDIKGEVELDVKINLEASYIIKYKMDKVKIKTDYVDYKI